MAGNLSRDTQRKYAIILALSQLDKPSLQDIAQQTCIPAGTVKRQLTAIRNEFKLRILFIRDAAESESANGFYALDDWGILNRDEFLRYFGTL
ncbi:helix-turn-helix domain-containing protein [Halomonas sp. McH1-25]|uniref:helix-turn-helix domain-containing protein n=1 Tax=unclassified Halomonas TaxID=2609666 RepID=UPI001EF44C91|nr:MULTISPECIES: helix-turn-helix domain-containing protein [unclassified Halomonas]MCG7602053.1 helix-turn-helix domain-containing protein [Halomonas sp. McH1-25]MCP1342889.1 helix-turn-helix domain-containing protein [Halomonas sp. FL8]MCP1361672.1 helix-turn-helix domain-containing protein [Halomonas sp. BBD45]MCP1363631.1 helix-turn-helix domain-containing protein [Halomonas sp. BBD48]